MKRLATLLSVAAAVVLASPAMAQTTLLFNEFIPPQGPANTEIVNPWLAAISEATDGRVSATVPPTTLAPPPEQASMVQQGIADGAYILNSFLENTHPLLQLAALPTVSGSGKANAVALWRTYQKFFAETNPYPGLKLLGFFGSPPGNLYNMDAEPFDSVDDFSNIRMWSPPGTSAQAMSLLGAAVVPGPAARMYEPISSGVVDVFCCVEFSDLGTFNVLQFVKATTIVDGAVLAPTFSVFVSESFWNQLSAEDQQAIEMVSGEALARRSAEWDRIEKGVRADYVAQGGILEQASDEFMAELRRIWQPLIDGWIERADALGVDGQAAYDFYVEQVRAVDAES